MDKVKLDVLRPWISKKITEYLHIEDDVVVEFVYNQLEDKKVNESFCLQFYVRSSCFCFCSFVCCVVSLPKKDANQHDRLSEW